MTIGPGEQWGRVVARPARAVLAGSDGEIADALTDGSPVIVVAGDLARTLGHRPVGDRADVRELPIDLIDVHTDDGDQVACAHVVVRQRWWRGGWWTGQVVAVMNAEFVGDWDVAPRGHPNDGRVEVIECGRSLGLRDRLAVRRRLSLGTHLPHPDISSRSVRSADWTFTRPMVVSVDGRHHGTTTGLAISVRPDAAVVYS